MANDFFQHSANVVVRSTRALAAHINNIASEIATGLDKLVSEINLKRGTINYAVDTGAANAYLVALTYAPTSYTDGMEVVFKSVNANTGAATINLNSLGVKSIKRQDGSALVAGDLPANKINTLRYNSTSGFFEIQNSLAAIATDASTSATAAAASAAAAAVSETNAGNSETAAAASAAAAAASAATVPTYPTLTGNSGKYIRVASSETAVEYRTAEQTVSDLGIVYISADGVLCPHKNLVVNNNTGTPNSKADITADELILLNSSGYGVKASTVSLTADITVSGVNGLDTGAEAVSTWYHVWVIYNGVTTSALLSASSTSPTMPSGYTYKGYVGAIYNNSAGNFYTTKQNNRRAGIVGVSVLNGGTQTTETVVSLSTAVPTTAKVARGAARIIDSTPSAALLYITPTSSSAGYELIGNPGGTGSGSIYVPFSVQVITPQTIYYKVQASPDTAYIDITGWEY